MTNQTQQTGAETPLDSWKEIAGYLQRDVRTAMRWEKSEGLPVRRHQHGSRASVYAYRSELDAWRAARKPQADVSRPWPRWVPALAGGLALVAVAALIQLGPILNPPDPLAEASESEAAIKLTRVWWGPEVDVFSFGSVSPDAPHVSFVDWETGDLAVHDLKTGQNRRLTNKGTWAESRDYASGSRFSHDGQLVAYSWFNEQEVANELRVASLDGSKPRFVYRNPEFYFTPSDWSPDGKKIMVVLAGLDRTNRIALISAEDGSLEILKSLDWRWPQSAAFSPDGRYIAYDLPAKQQEFQRDIFLVAADGTRETVLIEHSANDRLLCWTPNGQKILFISDRTGTNDLWSLRVADGKAQGPAELVRRNLGDATPAGFGPGGAFYYLLSTTRLDIYTVNLNPITGRLSGSPRKVTERYVGDTDWAEWAPDGQQLAYLTHDPLRRFEQGSRILVIRDLESGKERDFKLNMNWLNRVRWSPHGGSLVTTASDARARQGLYRINLETGETTPLVLSEPGFYSGKPMWTPDGKALVFKRNRFLEERGEPRYTSIVRRDLESGQEQTIFRLETPPFLRWLDLSPDGREVAFTIDEGQDGRMWRVLKVAGLGGEPPRELHRVEQPNGIPDDGFVWTPDGKHLLLLVWENKSYDPKERPKASLWKIAREGGEPERLGLIMDRQVTRMRIHPSGEQLAFTVSDWQAELWRMENFLTESPEKK